MPEIAFYLDDTRYLYYKELPMDVKKRVMGRARQFLYRQLDALKE